jgi:hypothetical protein
MLTPEALKAYAYSYLEARRTGYSWGYFLRRFLVWYAIAAVIMLISVLVLWLLDASAEYFILLGGAILGCILRDFAWYGSMRALWPGVETFIDWKFVEETAGNTKPADAASR